MLRYLQDLDDEGAAGGPEHGAFIAVALELANRTDSETSTMRFTASLVAFMNDVDSAKVRASAIEVSP